MYTFDLVYNLILNQDFLSHFLTECFTITYYRYLYYINNNYYTIFMFYN